MVGAPEQPGAKRIPIDIVSDTVCPWCYIGKLRLEQAMKSFEGQGLEFEVRWHPYQLNPAAPQEGQNKLAMYRAKFGPQVDSMLPRMKDTFAEHGLTYSIGGSTGNTLNSHRLIHWAGLNYGSRAQNSLVEALFNDYFCQEKYINDRDVLLQAVEQVGLDREAAATVLDDPNMYRAEVESAINQARRQGISGVPNFTIDNKFQVSGAQSPQEFLRVFREVVRNKGAAAAKPVGAACTPEGQCL